jgi:4'-phosphopantetheinyl transferase
MNTLEIKPGHEMLWPFATSDFSMHAQEVHVWTALLDLPQAKVNQLASTLSPEECNRANRFRYELHGNRFIVGRGLLRTILAQYLKIDPVRVQFTYGSHGKPSLADTKKRLHFNLAHSEDLALIAVTGYGPVGVDVERIRVLDDFNDLVSRFFSSRETAAFRRLAQDQQPVAFFNLWTRKEAWLKATVTFLPGEPARLLRLPDDSETSANWSLLDLAPATGFAAAIAANGRNMRFKCRPWPSGSAA